ncbi:hypothetical protein WB794_11190 [Denitratimonas tolerans]|uniref:Uncharacterized protein n=1 Tax=Denitratimonas tolerans TaxID=1338420 RepID=A0AAW9R6Z6_9GAMM
MPPRTTPRHAHQLFTSIISNLKKPKEAIKTQHQQESRLLKSNPEGQA